MSEIIAPTGQGDGGQGGADGKVLEGLAKFLERHNQDATKAAQTLYEDNFKLREQNRLLKEKQIPDGAAVLTSDEAKLWEAYRAFGAPDAIKAIATEHGQYKTELDGLKRLQVLQSVAKAAGYNETVLAQLDKLSPGLIYEIKQVDSSGKKVDAAFVRDGDKETPIEQYASAKWAEFLPSLQLKAPGTPFIPQSQGNARPAQLTQEEIVKRARQSGIYTAL